MKRIILALILFPTVCLAADNIDVTSGTGNTVAFDDISGVKHQRVKIVTGSDGSSDGDVSDSNPMPVELKTSSASIGKLSANSGVDIGDVDVTSLPALPAGANNIGSVSLSGGLSCDISDPGDLAAETTLAAYGSCTAFRDAALSNSAVSVKASAGKLKRYYIFNPDSATCMLQIYNVASGSVVVGTTVPIMTLPIPAGGGANDSSIEGWNFDTAISLAATTTAGGSTACGANLVVNLCYD